MRRKDSYRNLLGEIMPKSKYKNKKTKMKKKVKRRTKKRGY